MDYPWTQADQTPELDALSTDYYECEAQIISMLTVLAEIKQPWRQKVLMREIQNAQAQLAKIQKRIQEISR